MVDCRRLSAGIVLFAICSLSLAGCHPSQIDPLDPTVYILSPSPDSSVSGPDVTVKTYVTNFELLPGGGTPPTMATGHLIYYLDVTAPMTVGESATTAEGTYVISTATTHVWMGVAPGPHTFTVQLVNSDDTPLDPPDIVRVPVVVK